jgi:hypothetical protein
MQETPALCSCARSCGERCSFGHSNRASHFCSARRYYTKTEENDHTEVKGRYTLLCLPLSSLGSSGSQNPEANSALSEFQVQPASGDRGGPVLVNGGHPGSQDIQCFKYTGQVHYWMTSHHV